MTGSMGAGGRGSDMRRIQRALEQLRAEVKRLEALAASLTARLEALENDD